MSNPKEAAEKYAPNIDQWSDDGVINQIQEAKRNHFKAGWDAGHAHALSAVELEGVRKLTVQIRNDWSIGRWIRVWASQDPIPNDIETEEFGKTAQFLEAEPVLALLAEKDAEITHLNRQLADEQSGIQDRTLEKHLRWELEAERARVKELEAALRKIARYCDGEHPARIAIKALESSLNPKEAQAEINKVNTAERAEIEVEL